MDRYKCVVAMKFYKLHTGMIICGGCLQQGLQDTQRGRFKGDEGIYPGMYDRVEDDQTEAYQCDSCLEQNDAYDELENPDLGDDGR